MKKKGLLVSLFAALLVLLTGCNSLAVLNPKGPVAKTQSDVIIFSIIVMAVVLLVVYVLYIYMLTKYRASKAAPDYEPPHMEGSKWLEITWTLIPVIIVIILSVVTVRSTYAVETTPAGYENDKPLVIYASSSNWKWHFSYPEEGIETVNYVNIPTNRPVEFRLYSFGPITSFWVPQLGGQKYAMSDMVTKLRLVAEHEGSFVGKNSNFSGKGFAHMEFEVLAMPPAGYTKWLDEVKQTASELTEQEFNTLLETDHVGRKTYTSTHLAFRPAPEGEHGGHNHGSSDADTNDGTNTEMDHSKMDHSTMDHSNMGHDEKDNQEADHSQHGN
ncbi:cytochrome aa3 quinol oxidase subunit II [Paenibacillus apiarius]|uniref:Quinol oxidase subunit 2 n=1 Tax=Paenibacillus apiarius TaxID=46240 RepID=A0ABT4DQ93_9BACL|nr:cytochrome aa3 quinol oxidase subunit II [Paenibacillus apiarius]MBN3524192.1 cytochrome aa3 quinol oxidase subunit II [Paenibacillus apiarius]MCY9513977.1 cytochrome aa3 quinol oxidase subunit II [Paenibacillus apiarius]MCY9519494.1 cytochrome aa3 quinol oxidase subunit II [Paenibacillus apiarius]MCY9552421.1 cytochrome aa3 quinol oxidase subunit II [Paenibacillus apiarius]MCY9556250.1 cytochrome aa3 quinol oxidase subunit II [Paenibacillus apiarius]